MHKEVLQDYRKEDQKKKKWQKLFMAATLNTCLKKYSFQDTLETVVMLLK